MNMKKNILLVLVLVLGFSLISINIGNAYAQTLYVDAHLGELKKIEDSKYMASALNVVRDSEGRVISVVETIATRYLSDPITDQYLETLEVIKRGNINGKDVKMMQVAINLTFEDCKSKMEQTSGYISACNSYNRPFVSSLVVNNGQGEKFEIFRGLNHGYVLKPTDTITTYWTIITTD